MPLASVAFALASNLRSGAQPRSRGEPGQEASSKPDS